MSSSGEGLVDGDPARRRWIAPFLALVAFLLLPWTFWLTQTLPAHHVSEHWRTAWTGFDLALAATFVLSALALARRATWLQAAVTATGTMLLCDAWFDSLLSEHPHLALAEAAFSELPLALLCFWVARDTARFWGRWQQLVDATTSRDGPRGRGRG